MNEQTAKLIEQLAHNIGTTTDYLWSVLLKQAPISAIMGLIYLILVCIGGVFLLKAHKSFSKKNEAEYTKYDYSANLELIMVIVAFIWVILFVVALLNIDNVINGFFCPEYWALDKII